MVPSSENPTLIVVLGRHPGGWRTSIGLSELAATLWQRLRESPGFGEPPPDQVEGLILDPGDPVRVIFRRESQPTVETAS